ncbi:lysylphosphatidylglycerol synthase domain-containing protein [Pseudomonas sp. RIT-PI-AD]|uniref:lysylphosphatidylglycerol synthase domain-containing protein n=1 Tax=Pseudomonas sp. RIT-PI-AD TaxID=3035294 RepID=UPI0021D96752|nr:lysylphosphatidylglycerol synthase domain-containing protein [Pseudomonas sp. RIT-PI-AD]
MKATTAGYNRAQPQDGDDAPSEGRTKGKKRFVLLKRILTLGFFILVAVLFYMLAKKLDWQEVMTTLREYRPQTLLLAAAVTLLSYLVYSAFDLLGRLYSGHHLPARQILPLTFVCYAFNLNLGSWVGSIAFRYRLYSRLGLDNGQITKVLSFSLLTNWLGYILLAGVVFAMRLVELPEGWKIGTDTLQLIGFGLVAAGVGYLLACRFSKRRTWTLRGKDISLPSLRLALAQAALGAANWALMALVVAVLLPKVGYPTILGVLLISSIAGAITHIPAGLGVIEAIFIAMLSHQVSKGGILAALIGYRFIYFLLPLVIATVIYLVLEARAKKLRQKNIETKKTVAERDTSQNA